ncbi:uncharacterized protein [Mytilus edulis]|uniref:uncharacterized protein n=1 Tax=Mytilus edulis TaxID=6550 RepID=UPI0039F0D1A9
MAMGVKDSTAISDLQRRIDNISQVTENKLSQNEMRIEDLSEYSKSLDSKTHQKELEIRKIQTTTVPILAYHPSESESNMNKILPDLGTITVDPVLVPMPMLDIFQQGQFSVSDERKLSLTHSFQTTKLGNEVKIYRGCFIPGNRLLLCQDGGRQLYVCQLDGSKPEIINLDYTPEHITLYDNNHAVVSSGWDGIQIIDLTSLKPGGIIRIEGNCDGITTVKDKILVQNRPNTLTIVDIKGKVQNTIITTFHPWEIFANKDGDMYCTDFDSDKVYVVTSDGQEREIYDSPDLKNPFRVAIDDRGDVYVACGGSNNIHKISSDGQKHEIVLKADDGINGPTGLCYDYETRELLVINNNYSSINIYKTY